MTIAIIAVVSVGFLIAIVAVDYEPKKLAPVFLMLFWMPLVALHELGHAITAKLLGWRVCEVVVGYGRKLGTVRLLGIETQFRMIPLEGFVIPAPRDLRGVKWKSALIYFAGPGIEILFVLVCLATIGPDRLFTVTENIGVLAVQAACVAAAYGVVSNLIPRSIKTSSGSTANDGMGIIASFLTPLADYDQRRATPLVVDLRHLARQERWEEVIARSEKGLEEFPGNEGLRACRVLALTETARFREARDGLVSMRDDRPVVDSSSEDESRENEFLVDIALLDLVSGDDDLQLEAELMARRATEVDDADPLAQALWGTVQASRFGIFDGLAAIGRAIALCAGPAERQDCSALQAFAELRLGHVADAVATLEDIESSRWSGNRPWLLRWAKEEVDRASTDRPR